MSTSNRVMAAAALAVVLARLDIVAPAVAVAQNIASSEVENPYLDCEVGDWVLMERVLPLPSGPIKGQERRTIKSKDDSKIVIQYTSIEENGEQRDFLTQSIDLTKPFTTLTLLGYPSPGFPIRILREGDATITIAKRKLKTHWITYSLEAPGQRKDQKQVWRCDKIPVDGLVKEIQTSSFGGPSTVTLIDYGFADPEKNKQEAPTEADEAASQSWVNSIGMKLQPIPSGGFTMGEMPKTQFLRKSMELSPDARLELLLQAPPQRSEIIEQAFFVAAHEVTIGQFRQFVEATGYRTDAERDGMGGTGLREDGTWGPAPRFTWREYGFDVTDDHAVANVSWNDAQAFCKWLSAKERCTYRLLAEAEWEYCCRANTETTYFTGDAPESLEGFANMADKSLAAVTPGLPWALHHDDGHPYISPVGKFRANAFGLYDIHGNVLEWCGSTFTALDPLPEVEAPEPPGVRYVVRGGHWFGEPKRAGAACRSGAEPNHRMSLIGFRIATDTKPDSFDASKQNESGPERSDRDR